MARLRQMFCVHWFDVLPRYEYEYGEGQIVCTEQKTFRAVIEPRTCSKCGLNETRRIGEPSFLGWN